ncbi:uroporphyrinogen-III synthase [Aureimonas flava]|uniref:uroporphyrinogen-III synthase n=1 Tax=Aureimonas flava TaxID=2320271 RepID=UPI001459FCC0|nr:uroporphyrinogen-III synthase [Aureimonas flava]
MARVLVLREAEDGTRTAEALRARGHEPLLLPLQTACLLDPPPGGGPVGGFIATSAHAAPWLARHAAGMPVLAVGARTAEALRGAGLGRVVEGPGRARDLVPMAAALGSKAGAPLVYAAGRLRLPDLETGLRARAVPFRTIEVYGMDDRVPDEAEIDRALAGGLPDAALILSRRQAELFEALAARRAALLHPALRPLCLSAAVAARLRPGRRGEWGERPTLDRLLALLD